MLFLLIILGLAIVSFKLTGNIRSDIGKTVLVLIILYCLIAFLISASWMFKLLIVIVLLVFPTCFRERNSQPSCPRFCILRSKCLTHR